MNGWLFIAVTVLSLWALWAFLSFVLDVLDIYLDHYRAVSRREDAQATKGKGSFS